MKCNTFDLVYDTETWITYVKKVVDELTKNHKEVNSEITTGFMPQILDVDGKPHKMCPVRSYENYINHLHKDSDELWQQPLKKIPRKEDDPWYKAKHVGHNPMEKFMSNLSEKCELPDYYTNHCIRVTGTTRLMRRNITPRQIMSISGHKGITSLPTCKGG